MAKKSRTPSPPPGPGGRPKPPKPAAPAAAQAPRAPRDPRRTRVLLAGGGALAVVVVVVIVLALTLGGGTSLASSMSAAGCQLFAPAPSQAPVDGQVHFETLPDGFEYNTFPASQGPHYPVALQWGFYSEPLEEIRKVHNLEHGGVAIQWGDQVPADVVQQIAAWYEKSPNALIAAPLPALGDKIALTAWAAAKSVANEADAVDETYTKSSGRLAYCTSFDEKAFTAFRDQFRGKGIERIDLRNMGPGQ